MRFYAAIFFFVNASLSAQGYIAAIGGGSENYNSWSDKPYSWIVEKSDSGKIVILSDDDATSWLPNYFRSLGAVEAINLKIHSREAADSQAIYDEIISAKAVFIKGGDQYKYISLWKGTRTEDAIKEIFNRGGVVSGTSAGAMVLGGIDFSAKRGSAYPRESLQNPFYSRIDLENDFLNLMPSVLFDTHFIERGRVGRLIPFMINYKVKYLEEIIGVGIDDRTAICINHDGIGEVYGSGAVAIFRFGESTALKSEGSMYWIDNLYCDQLVEGWRYNFNTFEVTDVSENARIVNFDNDEIQVSTELIITGSDIAAFNSEAPITYLIDKKSPSKVIIFYDEQNINSANAYAAKLNSLQIDFFMIQIEESVMEQLEAIEYLNNADAIVLAAQNYNTLMLLNDTTYSLSRQFKMKIQDDVTVLMPGNSSRAANSFFVDGTDDYSYAGYYGEMQIKEGLNLINGIFIQPKIFYESDFYENRVSAVLYGMMNKRNKFGIYLDHSDYLYFSVDDQSVKSMTPNPFFIVNASNTTLIDSSVFSPANNSQTRQVVGMNNLRYSVSNLLDEYSLTNRSLVTLIEDDKSAQAKDFFMISNYPNPFNASTTLYLNLPLSSSIKISIFNILGQEIADVYNGYLKEGNYNINIELKEFSSGIYFVLASYSNKQFAHKINYIK